MDLTQQSRACNATMRTTSGLSVASTGSPMSQDQKLSVLSAAAIALCILPVLACAASDARAQSSARPKASAYPAVEDVPPRPEKPAMTAEEQLKLKKELGAARDRQAPKGKSSAPGAAKP